MKRLSLLPMAALLCVFQIGFAHSSEFIAPWADKSTTIILDPYAPNELDFDKAASDKRVVGIIHQISRGLEHMDVQYKARREEARKRNYLWGSYFLLTTDDPKTQVDRYLDFAGTHSDETYALDVECLDTDSDCGKKNYKITPNNVRAALLYFHERTGNFPLLYINDSVRKRLSVKFADDPKLAEVQLWYARFKSNISNTFPDKRWKSYKIWQFSSEINCDKPPNKCPYRVPGTKNDMDLNVYNGSEADLRNHWPLNISK